MTNFCLCYLTWIIVKNSKGHKCMLMFFKINKSYSSWMFLDNDFPFLNVFQEFYLYDQCKISGKAANCIENGKKINYSMETNHLNNRFLLRSPEKNCIYTELLHFLFWHWHWNIINHKPCSWYMKFWWLKHFCLFLRQPMDKKFSE